MRIDSIAVFQAKRESNQKARPEVRETTQPETARTSLRSLRFQKHQGSQRWMVEVVDAYNNEVIREIPNRKMLDVVGELRSQIGKMQDTRC